MIKLYLFSLLVMVTYTVMAVVTLKGVPQSYSNTRYLFSSVAGEAFGKIAFYAWTILTGLPLLIVWLNLTDGCWYQFMVFFSVTGLFFVGAAEDYLNNKITANVHYVGAAGAALISQAVAIVAWWPSVVGITAMFALMAITGSKVKAIGMTPIKAGGTGKIETGRSSMMFFLEVAAFSLVYTEVLIAILRK